MRRGSWVKLSSFHLTTLSIPHVGIIDCRKMRNTGLMWPLITKPPHHTAYKSDQTFPSYCTADVIPRTIDRWQHDLGSKKQDRKALGNPQRVKASEVVQPRRWPSPCRAVPGMGDSSISGVSKTSEIKAIHFESPWEGGMHGLGNLGSQSPWSSKRRDVGPKEKECSGKTKVVKSGRWQPRLGASWVKTLDPGVFQRGAGSQED
jgi:hypothetical protein